MIRNKIKCPTCNKEISLSNYDRHVNKCSLPIIQTNNTITIKEEWLQPNGKYKCPECEKEYSKNGIASHIWRSHKNKTFNPFKGKEGWHKGKTKLIDDRLKKLGESISRNNSGKNSHWYGKHHSKQTKEKISKTLAQNNSHNGGYKKVPYIEYILTNGDKIKLRGSYEVRLANYLDNNNLKWIYQKPIQYIDNNGQLRHMLPDFYIPSLNKYFDTKGYLTKEFKEKLELVKSQLNIKINLVFLKDLINIEKGIIKLENF